MTSRLQQRSHSGQICRRFFRFSLGVGALFLAAANFQDESPEGDRVAEAGAAEEPRAGFLVPIDVPIGAGEDQRVRRIVDQILAQSSGQDRPTIIFEFRVTDAGSPQGRFGSAFQLAEYLTSAAVSRAHTVAYVPQSTSGHAVLAVMACEQIIMAPDAELGSAGLAEPVIKATYRSAYQEVASYRATIPVPIALGMLDPDLAVYRLQMLDGGVRYCLAEELEALRPQAASEEEVIRAGELGRFSGRELRLKYGFVSHVVNDRKELALALRLRPGSIEENPSLEGAWKGVAVEVQGQINSHRATQALRAIREATSDSSVNFICVQIQSPGGPPKAVLRLAGELSELDSSRVRTVALIDREARSGAALVAMACDDVAFVRGAILGGAGDPSIPAEELDDLKQAIQAIARDKSRDWSLLAALVDQRLTVHRFTREGTGELRFFCDEELAEQDNALIWQRGEALDLRRGLTAEQAQDMGLARHVVESLDELRREYAIDQPLEVAQPSWIVMQLERLASSPWFARAMLFIAFFAFMSELSSPGIGAAAFISALCFLLFFWAQFLNGNAGWLEALLFIGGAAFLAIELLLLPGFGIFGIGGALMILASIILASQTFVLPQNSYQLRLLPSSLMMAVSGLGGALAAGFLMRRYLSTAPGLRRLMLAPPAQDELESLNARESLVSWSHLTGKRGITTTKLTPSGKARIGDDLVNVISHGEAIAKGTAVYVREVQGNRVVVAPVEGDSPT